VNPENVIQYLERLSYSQRRSFYRKQKFPPQFVYKFRQLDPSNATSVDRIRDVIVRSRFWLSSPLHLNDPFDTSARVLFDGSIEQKKQRIDEILRDNEALNWKQRREERRKFLAKTDSEKEAILAKLHSETADKVGVYSFAGDPLSILMWSHYTLNHEGLCFQFDSAKDPRTFVQVVKMEYSDDYPVLNWTTDFYAGIHIAITRKHSCWAYERETRIILPERSNQYLPFRPEALRSIIVGCCAAQITVDKLNELLQERSAAGLPAPKLYHAVKHERKYKLLLRAEPNF
jgi:hypothetical protein